MVCRDAARLFTTNNKSLVIGQCFDNINNPIYIIHHKMLTLGECPCTKYRE